MLIKSNYFKSALLDCYLFLRGNLPEFTLLFSPVIWAVQGHSGLPPSQSGELCLSLSQDKDSKMERRQSPHPAESYGLNKCSWSTYMGQILGEAPGTQH